MSDLQNGTNVVTGSISKFIIRLVSATIVLAITAFLTPGFTISGFLPLILSAALISVIDFALEKTGLHASPLGSGLSGFVLAAAIIYFSQFFVAGFNVTVISALIGALVYGIVDAIIPGKAM